MRFGTQLLHADGIWVEVLIDGQFPIIAVANAFDGTGWISFHWVVVLITVR